MTEKLWKRHEREIAERFGAERALQKGRGVPDFETDSVVGEVKSRKTLPKWLKEAVEQARRYASPFNGKLPVTCIKEKGARGFLVVVHSQDFVDWYGDLPVREMDERCRDLLCPKALALGLDVTPDGLCARKRCPSERG